MDDLTVRDFDLLYSQVRELHDLPPALKDEQRAIVMAVLKGKNTCGVLPTGYGKSLAYILPPLIKDQVEPEKKHFAVVIVPLRSLMQNQVATLARLGIKAAAITRASEMTEDTVTGIRNGDYSIIFASPEVTTMQQWRDVFSSQIYQESTMLLCIDEAHCVVQWGKTFRPTYKNDLPQLRAFLPVPLLFLTATLPANLKAETLKIFSLKEKDTCTFALLPDRPNIFLEIKSSRNMVFQKELHWLVNQLLCEGILMPKTILYCRRTNDAPLIYAWMCEVMGYSGRTPPKDRLLTIYHSSSVKDREQKLVEEFCSENSHFRLLICTMVFGMGVQVPDIAQVVHWGPSQDPLCYWQEIGRCARKDGSQGRAIMFAVKTMLNKNECSKEFVEIATSNTNCIRRAVLTHLALPEMDLSLLKENKDVCNYLCSKCQCHRCRCCSVCRLGCPCTQYETVTEPGIPELQIPEKQHTPVQD